MKNSDMIYIKDKGRYGIFIRNCKMVLSKDDNLQIKSFYPFEKKMEKFSER
jgi:hypothetical protein